MVGPRDKIMAGRRRGLLLGLPIVAAAIMVFGAPCYLPGPRRVNALVQEIDLNSGLVRRTRFLLYCQIWQEEEQTPASKAIASDGLPVGGRLWVVTNRSQPGIFQVHVHPQYHGALAAVNMMANLWTDYSFDAAARAKSARQLLRAMREDHSYHAGFDYYRTLDAFLRLDPTHGRAIAAADIPDDLPKRARANRTEESPRQSADSPDPGKDGRP